MAFVIDSTALQVLPAGADQRVMMDNLGRVFITGSLVLPSAAGFRCKRFGEFISSESPNLSLQALTVALLDASSKS